MAELISICSLSPAKVPSSPQTSSADFFTCDSTVASFFQWFKLSFARILHCLITPKPLRIQHRAESIDASFQKLAHSCFMHLFSLKPLPTSTFPCDRLRTAFIMCRARGSFSSLQPTLAKYLLELIQYFVGAVSTLIVSRLNLSGSTCDAVE